LSFDNVVQYIQSFVVTSDWWQNWTRLLQVNPSGNGQIYFNSGIDTVSGVVNLWITVDGKIVKTDDDKLTEVEVDSYVDNNWYITGYTETDPIRIANSGNYQENLTISNWLTENAGNLKLWGGLLENTTIDASSYNLIFNNIGTFSVNTSDYDQLYLSNMQTSIVHYNLWSYSSLSFQNNGIIITDDINNRWLEYQSDYSGNFIDRSLVDKGYVDAEIANVIAGLIWWWGGVVCGWSITISGMEVSWFPNWVDWTYIEGRPSYSNGDNFAGKVFLNDTIDMIEPVELSGDIMNCRKQLRGFFWNNARGNRLWPLDNDVLDELKILDVSYKNLVISGGFYSNCDGDDSKIYWSVKHTWNGTEYVLVAGVDYDFDNNVYANDFSGSLVSYLDSINGYLFDSYGWIWEVYWTGILICDQTWNGSTADTCTNSFVMQSNDCGGIRTVAWTKSCSVWSSSSSSFSNASSLSSSRSSHSVWGSSRWATTKKDNCPDGDYSNSYYDHSCGKKPVVSTETWGDTKMIGNLPGLLQSKFDLWFLVIAERRWYGVNLVEKIRKIVYKKYGRDYVELDSVIKEKLDDNKMDKIDKYKEENICSTEWVLWYQDEILKAFDYAYKNKITTQCPIEKANLGGDLIRQHFAKMMTEYAMNVLWQKPDLTKDCFYTDMGNETYEMVNFAKLSCQLWIMGVYGDGTAIDEFSPNAPVTRAIFGTVLSRLLYWDKYNVGWADRYSLHLMALKNTGIMYWIDEPESLVQRWHAMLMLMRAAG